MIAFLFWITLSVAVHELEPDQKNLVDKDHKHCNVYLASPEYLARRGQLRTIDTDTCRKYQLMTFIMYEAAWFFISVLIIFAICAHITSAIKNLQCICNPTMPSKPNKFSFESTNDEFDDQYQRFV